MASAALQFGLLNLALGVLYLVGSAAICTLDNYPEAGGFIPGKLLWAAGQLTIGSGLFGLMAALLLWLMRF